MKSFGSSFLGWTAAAAGAGFTASATDPVDDVADTDVDSAVPAWKSYVASSIRFTSTNSEQH